jgi:hypothetical protein
MKGGEGIWPEDIEEVSGPGGTVPVLSGVASDAIPLGKARSM